MSRQLCTVCGDVTSRGSRCPLHPRASGIGANRSVHSNARWTRLSRRLIAKHLGQYGWICSGDGIEHPAHPSRDLTLDHTLAMVDGGAAFPPDDELRVLCRSWNSALGARAINAKRAGRTALRASNMLTERAAIRARYLG